MTLQETYERVNRGMNEEFDIWPSETQAGAWHVLNVEKATRYWVTMDSCSCPDWQYRCANAGVPCKHGVALERWLMAMPEDAPTQSATEWLSNLDMTEVNRHLAEDANEPDPSWVVGECPRCGAPLVENSRYVGGRGYTRSVECWRGLQDGRPDACYIRRGR